MYATVKRNVVEVEIQLDEKDIELLEKDSFAFGDMIKKILEAEKGSKLVAFGYNKPKICRYDSFVFGSTVAYWWGKDREVKQGV